MAECFAADAKDVDMPTNYPLSYMQLQHEQQKDKALKDYVDKHSAAYSTEDYKHGDKTYNLITKNCKTVVPKSLQKRAVKYYHSLLMHPGETRTELTIAQHFTWKGLCNTVRFKVEIKLQSTVPTPAAAPPTTHELLVTPVANLHPQSFVFHPLSSHHLS